jgi:mannose-6-phosphate isomerase
MQPFTLHPEYRDYVWGGDRLRPGHSPTAEIWAVHEGNLIASGPHSGQTLRQLSSEQGDRLLGRNVQSKTPGRFPLLIKLLDCADWLSLQVHPDDKLAIELEGPGMFGKTEAWHVLDAAPGARLIAGMKPGTSAKELATAIKDGNILSLSQYLDAHVGDTVFMPAGTIHALGPGLLIYEVQQSSDLTYRVYDWGRPETEKRKLHIDKSLAVTNPQAGATAQKLPPMSDGDRQVLASCQYFTLEMLTAQASELAIEPRGLSFHILTVIEGQARIASNENEWTLNRFETLVIPAECAGIHILPGNGYRALHASVEQLTD